jgi:hypothetical protein
VGEKIVNETTEDSDFCKILKNLFPQVKKKWQAIEKKITRVALNRQTVSQVSMS